MNKKTTFIKTAVLFFAGTLFSILSAFLLPEDISVGLVIGEILPEIILTIIFLFIAFYKGSITPNIIKNCWKVLFSVFCANALLVLFSDPLCIDCDLVFFLQKMPFATLFFDIVGIFGNPDAYTIISFVGNAIVFSASIYLLVALCEKSSIMSFGNAVKTCYKKYFSFAGCATRAELWWYYLYFLVGCFILFSAMMSAFLNNHGEGLGIVFLLVFGLFLISGLFPLYSALVRRMHDVGVTGFLVLIPIVPFIISILPSNKDSKYRDMQNKRSAADTILKIILVFITISAITNSLSKIKNNHNDKDYEYYDDIDDYEEYDYDSIEN